MPLLSLLLLSSVVAPGGQVVTVTTRFDVVDFGGTQQVADLPGPDGRVSFREAVIATNNEPGPQTIHFAIPPSEYQGSPVAMLELEIDAFFVTDDATTIDFRTQTAFAGDTNPNGWEVGIFGLEPNGYGIAAILVLGDDCTLIGLDDVQLRGYATELRGNRNRVLSYTTDGPLHAAIHVAGSFGGPAATGNVVGGTAAGEGNVVSSGGEGIRITGPADDNVVIGNTCIGSRFSGIAVVAATQFGVFARRNRIGGRLPGEGNWIAANGSWGEEGFPVGEQIRVVDTDNTVIERNLVGTTQDGMADHPIQRGPIGIEIRGARRTVVRGNVVSGTLQIGTNHYAGQRFGTAIVVSGLSSRTTIVGNRIGTSLDGSVPIPNVLGIAVSPLVATERPFATRIGGVQPAQGNVIAFSERDGVTVSSVVDGVTIRGNAIFDNVQLGIELLSIQGSGVTPNDSGDGDDGANRLQNFPVVQRAFTTGSSITVAGFLMSTPLEEFELDFFASPDCDPSGFGEGALFLGSESIATNAQGAARFQATFVASVPTGWVVTSTATRVATGDTSEFSACRSVQVLPGGE